jgi:hypothetical protein
MRILLLAMTLTLGQCAVAQTTFTTIGNTTFGSDGSIAISIGDTTFVTGSNQAGPAVQHMSAVSTVKTTAQSSAIQEIGNITFITESSGEVTTLQKIGGTTFGSDGSTVQKIGNTYFVVGGNDAN